MIGGPVIRQHLVEFISGTGIVTDGVTDTSQGTSGPFSWTPPIGVAQIFVNGCGGGGGGGGGYSTGIVRSGGGGGGSGMSVINVPLPVYPNAALNITLGAGGNGGATGSPPTSATAGGHTLIANLPTNAPWTYITSLVNGTFQISLGNLGAAATSTNGGSGGRAGAVDSTNRTADGGAGGTGNQATPTGGGTTGWNAVSAPGLFFVGNGGAGGGGASNSATTNGAIGGSNTSSVPFRSSFSNTNGGQDGVASYGGGGTAGASMFGYGRNGGGNTTGTNQNGLDGLGFGSGGSGAGGNGNGGNGRVGYVSITYWSAD